MYKKRIRYPGGIMTSILSEEIPLEAIKRIVEWDRMKYGENPDNLMVSKWLDKLTSNQEPTD